MNLEGKKSTVEYLIRASHDMKRSTFCMQHYCIYENCRQIATENIKSSFCSVFYLFTKPLMKVYNQQPFLKLSKNTIQWNPQIISY